MAIPKGICFIRPSFSNFICNQTVNEYSDENDDLVSGSTKTATIRVVNNTQNNNSSSNNQINNSRNYNYFIFFHIEPFFLLLIFL